MSKHRTTWEDERMAGVECDGKYVGMITTDPDDNPWTCEQCGAQLRLIWNVRLEELPAAPTIGDTKSE